ncbi:MAG: hypothetical protein MK107_11060, partial [Oceanicola sp.]|nr:hypothetical protein [Oceanicola sp.]
MGGTQIDLLSLKRSVRSYLIGMLGVRIIPSCADICASFSARQGNFCGRSLQSLMAFVVQYPQAGVTFSRA